MDRTTPVLIVGAGPSGLAAAAELAHHGVACVVVEPRATVEHDRPRAKTTSARTMEHFRRWGVAAEVRAAASLSPDWSDRVVFCDSLAGAVVTSFDGCFGLRAGDVAAERGQQIPQPRVEEVLRRHVARQPGVELILGAAVTALDGTTATVRHADGRRETVTAQYVLGCDGPNGVTRASLGIDFAGDSDPRPNFNIVFRAPELETPLGDAVQYWIVGAEVPGVLGRLDLDGTWWAIAPGVDAARGAADPSALVEALVGHPVAHEILATDPWTARMLIAERYRQGPTFLVGDAAHLNPPWGGHGYNTCVGDAVNIAWKLAAVLQGWAGPALLDTYETERRPIAEQTIGLAVANMTTLPTDLAADPGRARAQLATRIQAGKRAEFHSLGLVLGYDYGPKSKSHADLSTYVPATTPGRLLPHARFPDGRALQDRLGRGLTLVGPLAKDPDGVAALRAEATRHHIPLTALTPPDDYPWSNEFLLVRPDQHIAARSPTPFAGLADLF